MLLTILLETLCQTACKDHFIPMKQVTSLHDRLSLSYFVCGFILDLFPQLEVLNYTVLFLDDFNLQGVF